MEDVRSTYDAVAQHISRRRLVGAGAALAAGGGGLVYASDPTAAEVQIDGFSVPDETFERESLDPVLDVTAKYSYDAGMEPVAALRFAVSVDGTEIATDDLVTDAGLLDGDTTLSGPITDAEAWSSDDFAPDAGETVERQLSVTLSFEVLDSGDRVIVSDTATDTTTVTVENPNDAEQLTAAIGGSGTIRAADE